MVSDHGSYWHADVVEVIEPSADRVDSICPIAGVDGAGCCDLAFADPAAVRRLKEGTGGPILVAGSATLVHTLLRHRRGQCARYECEHRIDLNNDGAYAWVRARGRVVERDAEGRALRLAGTARDITTGEATSPGAPSTARSICVGSRRLGVVETL